LACAHGNSRSLLVSTLSSRKGEKGKRRREGSEKEGGMDSLFLRVLYTKFKFSKSAIGMGDPTYHRFLSNPDYDTVAHLQVQENKHHISSLHNTRRQLQT
jgi:hypothetical protein